MLFDTVDRAPTQPKAPAYRMKRCLTQAFHHIHFESVRIAPSGVRPRHPDGEAAMLRALDARHFAPYDRPVFARIEMTPAPASHVVSRAVEIAQRTNETRIDTNSCMDEQDFLEFIERGRPDFPWKRNFRKKRAKFPLTG